jgi:hypothetical protein
LLVVVGEVENPIGVDELVTEIEGQPLESVLEDVIGFDAVGPHQQQQIGRLIGGAGRVPHLGALPSDAPFDLGAHVVGGGVGILAAEQELARRDWHGPALGVEDHARGGAFDVDRPAILPAPAVIGHDRKGMLFALPRRLQVL